MSVPFPRLAGVAAVAAASALAGCGAMNRGGSDGSAPGYSTSPPAATTMSMSSPLSAAQEVPPVSSAGTGTVVTRYDRATRALNYTVTYSGLTGALTAAHFHGPAMAGSNAGVALPITAGPSPISGRAVLTDAQAADLLAGRWYLNLHTAAHPAGEIRGQIVLPR